MAETLLETRSPAELLELFEAVHAGECRAVDVVVADSGRWLATERVDIATEGDHEAYGAALIRDRVAEENKLPWHEVAYVFIDRQEAFDRAHDAMSTEQPLVEELS